MRISYQIIIFVCLLLLFPGVVNAQERIDAPVLEENVGSSIYDVEWNFSGDVLAVATGEGWHLYDSNLQLLQTIYPERRILSISWKPSSDKLAVAVNSDIEIWNWDSLQATLSFETRIPGNGSPLSVAWSSDGSFIARISAGFPYQTIDTALGEINIWNATNQQVLASIPDLVVYDASYPTDDLLTWNSNSNEVATVGNRAELTFDGNVRYLSDIEIFIWNINSQSLRSIPIIGTPYALSVAWQPSSNMIAIGGYSNVDYYDAIVGNYIRSIPSGIDISSLDWSKDGQYLANRGQIIDVSSQTTLGLLGSEGSVSTSSSWKADGSLLVVGNWDGTLRIENSNLLPGYSASSIRSTCLDTAR